MTMNEQLFKSDYFKTNKFLSREDWLKFRLNGIGGSDASCVIGLNNWKTNRELWLEKVNKVYEEIEDNESMEFGRDAEDSIRYLFTIKNKKKYVVDYLPNTILTNNEHPYLIYSPDGLLSELETGKKGIWECKTGKINSAADKDKWENGNMPESYYIQCLHGLIVTGYDFVILTAYLEYEDVNGNEYFIQKNYRIDRDKVVGDLEYLKGKEIDFWESVEKKIEPKLLLTL